MRCLLVEKPSGTAKSETPAALSPACRPGGPSGSPAHASVRLSGMFQPPAVLVGKDARRSVPSWGVRANATPLTVVFGLHRPGEGDADKATALKSKTVIGTVCRRSIGSGDPHRQPETCSKHERRYGGFDDRAVAVDCTSSMRGAAGRNPAVQTNRGAFTVLLGAWDSLAQALERKRLKTYKKPRRSRANRLFRTGNSTDTEDTRSNPRQITLHLPGGEWTRGLIAPVARNGADERIVRMTSTPLKAQNPYCNA